MTEKRIHALAAKLWAGTNREAVFNFDSLAPGTRSTWFAIARIAVAELRPKPRRRAARPKACRIDAHGKRVCT